MTVCEWWFAGGAWVLQTGRPSGYNTLIPPVTCRALSIQTAWALAALSCPALHAIEYGPHQSLTVPLAACTQRYRGT